MIDPRFFSLFNIIKYYKAKRGVSRSNLLVFKYPLYLFALSIFFVLYVFIINELKSNTLLKTKNFSEFLKTEEFQNTRDYLFQNLKTPYKEFSYIIKSNDTIEKILRNYEVSEKDIKDLALELKKKNLSNIFVGTKIKIIIKNEDSSNKIVSILYPESPIVSIDIRKDKDNFIVKKNILKLYKKEVIARNTIKNNLYNAAVGVDIEPNVIIEFARIYGFEIDFQRDIRKGDTFEIYYEKYVDENNITRNTGKIIYASMNVNSKDFSLYNFNYKKEQGYYDVDGKSVVKALMKTPINGARLSSAFGMRKHPILGFNKLHTGTDFAAPSGTPIMASGSGTITRARWCGGGGNCVKIRHNSTYETVYAHLKGFAKGIKEGRKVRQGQIIGYVGSTGMSTGPHLHYEVIVNKKKVNSQKLKLPSGKTLSDDARKVFEIERIKVDVKLSELRSK